jgi:UDPglucose 6-dehydrogenase
MRIAVIGTGHVGLVTCATWAALGHDVVGIDSDEEKMVQLEAGQVPFFEPGLQELVTRGLESGALGFTGDMSRAVSGAEVVFICVGTPPKASGEASLAAVERAALDAARSVTGPAVLVEKSTVPAGTAERIQRMLRRNGIQGAAHLEVVSNPEFTREGRAVEDSLRPERIVVGADSPRALETMRRLHQPLIDRGCTYIETDIQTAELAKHASNAFLALKISYANALARLCERLGADVITVADVMGADRRIGRDFLDAGLGYGGFCFPKDLQAFEALSDKVGYRFSLLGEVARINDEAVEAVVDKIKDGLWNIDDKRIALLGLSFKPQTDDVRFAPPLSLARRLLDEGAQVVGHDPQALSAAKEQLPEIDTAYDPYDAVEGAHCVVICTEWPEFRDLDLTRLRRSMAYPVMVDGRNIFDPKEARANGFVYYPTGRPFRDGESVPPPA